MIHFLLVPEDYAKGTEKRGRFMGLMSNAASAISKLNSFSFLPSMNSYNSLGGVGMNYYPMKGLAMSMSSNYQPGQEVVAILLKLCFVNTL